MTVHSVTNDNFKTEVLDHKGVVLVDFFADWCGPCKMTAPIVHELAEEMKNVKFVKVNVDENEAISSEYSIFSIPTFIVFKDGKVVDQFVGGQTKENIKSHIDKVISG